MKKIIIPMILGFACIAFAFKGGETYKTLEIGLKAPMLDYKMKSTENEYTTLEGLKGENGTIVMFSCNTCPFVIAWEDRYPKLSKIAKEKGMNLILINSNEAKREGDDSMAEMKKHAKEKGYADVAYLVDEKSALANAFGGKSTPHVFLFDKNWELAYEGAIDDNYKNADLVETHYLKNAIMNLAEGKEIDPNNTKALGCSIKRVKI
ncbi:MAG: thioredoxin family protein [Flavobacteriales bacterium]|nr:thioredoxin family protein [Flavobacteriales bacterium]